MTEFGGKIERLACVLHEARMQECYGNWNLPHRFRWPETREQWEHYQHHPHSAVLQALAQAKAVAAQVDRSPEGGDRETGCHAEHESAVAKPCAPDTSA